MKKLYLLFFLSFFLNACKKDQLLETIDGPVIANDGDSAVFNLQNYRLVKILNFSKSTSTAPGSYVKYDYDKRGNMIKESFFSDPDIINTYKNYYYDGTNLTKMEIYDGQSNALTRSQVTTYTYDNNRLTEELLKREDGSTVRTTHYIYADNKLIEQYYLEPSLGKTNLLKFSYDSRGNITMEQSYMYNNELSQTTKYVYDALNRPTTIEVYDHNNTLVVTTKLEYSSSYPMAVQEKITSASLPNGSTRTYSLDQYGNQVVGKIGTNTWFKKQYYGKLLREQIRYSPEWGFSEAGMTRFEYEKK